MKRKMIIESPCECNITQKGYYEESNEKFIILFHGLCPNIIWYMINTYLMLFYTDVVSLSAGAISTIMLVARVWDAVNDPMMG